MSEFMELLVESGFNNLGPQNLVMLVVGGVLIYLAIKKGYEPLLLLPIGFGAILANMPLAHLVAEHGAEGEGLFQLIY